MSYSDPGSVTAGSTATRASWANAVRDDLVDHQSRLLAVEATTAITGTVRAATTANITISTALNNGDTLDGVTLATGDLVLVKNQTDATTNGIYVVGTSPARATAFAAYANYVGVLVTVQEGTTNADTVWLGTSDGAGVSPGYVTFSKRGDVTGPASATDLHIAVFDGTTGKLIADGGNTIAGVVALASGSAAAGGSDKQVQYNNSGALGGISNGTAGQVLTSNGSSSAPSFQSLKLVQVVSTESSAVATGTTIIPFDDTIPQSTEGDQYMTLSITPKSSSNTLIIDARLFLTSTTTPWLSVALFQDSGTDAIAASANFTSTSAAGSIVPLRHVMTAGTTSSTTFKLRAGPSNSATMTFNGASGARRFGGVMASTIVIMEIAP